MAGVLAKQDSAFFTPSPDHTLAVAISKKIGMPVVWNLMTGEMLGAIKSDPPSDVEFSPQGRRFAAVQPNGVEFFDVVTGDFVGGIDRPHGGADFREAAFLAPNEILIGDAVGGLQGFQITCGKPLRTQRFGPNAIANMAFNAAGQVLVGDYQGNLSVLGKDLAPLSGLTTKAYGAVRGTLRDEMNKQYDAGECTAYALMRHIIRLADRRDDCESAVVLRKASANFDAAISALACDTAAGIMTNSAKDQPRVDACRKAVTLKEDTRLHAAAKAADGCAKVAGLQARFNEPEAANECEFAKAVAGSSPRAMYLAAMKLDTGGDRTRATRLYTEIMTRFPEEDVAIDAANRLTALADLAKMEASKAEQAATQSAALKAAKARAAATAASAAAAQTQRNTSCDYVTVGQKFMMEGGGFFGLGDAYYTVIGISREGGIVTARLAGTDITNQFNCSSVN